MKFKYAAVLVPAAFVLTAAANAQTGNNNNNNVQANPFSLRVGAAWLTDSTAREGVGSTGLNAGAGFDLPFKGVFSQAGERGSIDFDYQGFRRHGNSFDVFSLSYVDRVPFQTGTTANSSQPSVYGGLGVGAFYDRASGGGDSTSRTTIGGTALIGVGFQQKYSLELAYNFRAKFHDVSPNSFTLSLGYHF